MYRDEKIYVIERLVAGLSYPTMGMVGFVWLILGLFTRAKLRPFLMYHIFQSIFISIALYLLGMLVGFIINILSVVPFVNNIVLNIVMMLNSPILWGQSVMQLIIGVLLVYLAVTAFMGMYSYIPYVSDIINQNVRR